MSSPPSRKYIRSTSLLGINESYGMELATLSLVNEQRNLILTKLRITRYSNFPVVPITFFVLWERLLTAVATQSVNNRNLAQAEFSSPPKIERRFHLNQGLYSVPKLFKHRLLPKIGIRRKHHTLNELAFIFCNNLRKEAEGVEIKITPKSVEYPEKGAPEVVTNLTKFKRFVRLVLLLQERLFPRYVSYYSDQNGNYYSKPEITEDPDYTRMLEALRSLMIDGATFGANISRILFRVLWKYKNYNAIIDFMQYKLARSGHRFDKDSSKIILDTLFELGQVEMALDFYSKALLRPDKNLKFKTAMQIILIRGLINSYNTEKALGYIKDLLRSANDNIKTPNDIQKLLVGYTHFVTLTLKRHNHKLAVEMIILFQTYVPDQVNARLYNPLLAYFSLHDKDRVLSLLKELMLKDLSFDSATYSILIDYATKNNDLDSVLSLIKSLQNTREKINLVVLGSILDSLSTFGFNEEVLAIYTYLRESSLIKLSYSKHVNYRSDGTQKPTQALKSSYSMDTGNAASRTSSYLSSSSRAVDANNIADIVDIVDIVSYLLSAVKNLALMSNITNVMFLAAHRSENYSLLLDLYQDSLYLYSVLPCYHVDNSYFYGYCKALVKFDKLDENIDYVINDMRRLKIHQKESFFRDLQTFQSTFEAKKSMLV